MSHPSELPGVLPDWAKDPVQVGWEWRPEWQDISRDTKLAYVVRIYPRPEDRWLVDINLRGECETYDCNSLSECLIVADEFANTVFVGGWE